MRLILERPCFEFEKAAFTEDQRSLLEGCLQEWRDKVKECSPDAPKWSKCLECRYRQAQHCLSFSGAREFFKQLKDKQIEIMCENFKLAFNKAVCTETRIWLRLTGYRMESSLTPPWGLLGLGYTLRDCSFTPDNYSSHHALGKQMLGLP